MTLTGKADIRPSMAKGGYVPFVAFPDELQSMAAMVKQAAVYFPTDTLQAPVYVGEVFLSPLEQNHGFYSEGIKWLGAYAYLYISARQALDTIC